MLSVRGDSRRAYALPRDKREYFLVDVVSAET